MHLVTVALASFFAWTVLRYVLPVVLPERLAILALGAVTYGVWQIPRADVTGILGAAGAALILVAAYSLTGDVPRPWAWSTLRRRLPAWPRRGGTVTATGTGFSPAAPPGDSIGRRIPPL